MSFDINDLDPTNWGCYDDKYGTKVNFSDLKSEDENLLNILTLDEYGQEIIEKYYLNDKFEYSEMVVKKNYLIKKISEIEDNYEILDVTLKILFSNYLDEAISSYAKEENLSKEFLDIVKNKNCLTILIKGFLKKQCKFVLNDFLIDEIDKFVESIYENSQKLIVYDRVTKIQRYIHFKVQNKFGENMHLRLNKKLMRNLLSTARLHLNIQDTQRLSPKDFHKMLLKTREYVQKEYTNPELVNLPSNKKFIPIWKAKKSKSLVDYLHTHVKSNFSRILDSDVNKNNDDFKKDIIRKYITFKF